MNRLNSHELRRSHPKTAAKLRQKITHQPLVLVLDNVLDTYNIGSFFRLADALGAQKIYLCGPCVTPPNLKIHRSSVGTWKWVPWESCQRVGDCLQKLKADGYHIIACEQGKNTVEYVQAEYKYPLAIIAGSETAGVGESSLKFCDQVVEIPMYGINKSLNVLVATSVIAFDAVRKIS